MTEERRRWSDALAALRHAGVAMRRFERQTAGMPFDAQERGQGAYDRLVDRYDAAMLRVVALPAPHLEALAFKTALTGDHRLWEVEGGEDCLVRLEADARRLADLGRRGTLIHARKKTLTRPSPAGGGEGKKSAAKPRRVL